MIHVVDSNICVTHAQAARGTLVTSDAEVAGTVSGTVHFQKSKIVKCS